MSASEQPRASSDQQQSQIELIESWEYKRVLQLAGYSYPELARYIGKSRSYVANVANGFRSITFRQVQELERFLGARLYHACITKVRRDQAQAEQRDEENRRRYDELKRERLTKEAEQASAERDLKASEIERQLDLQSSANQVNQETI